MIPKVFHQIWLGKAPQHQLFVEWRAKWRDLHPGWDFCEWTSAEHSEHQDLMSRACHNAQRSNILRLEILRRVGGVYLDTDIEPLKNIEPLLDGASAIASPFYLRSNGVNNSFIASEPGNPWLSECCERLGERDPAVPLSMGSRHITECLRNHPEVTVLDRMAVLQQAAWHGGIDKFRPAGHPFYRNIYAIHHFSYRWYPTGFERCGRTETGR